MSDHHIFSLVPVEVFMDDRLTKTDLRVLGAILSWRNKTTNLMWPKRSQIAERCNLSLPKISTATTHLVTLGWLKKEGKGGCSRSSQYLFCIPDFILKTVPDSGTVPKTGTVPDSGTKTVPDSGTRNKQTIEQTIKQTNVVVGAREKTENSDADAIEKNIALKKWLEYFMNVQGYAQCEAQTVDTVPMFLEWEKMGVTDDDMVFAELAVSKSLRGKKPTTPLYYRQIVVDIVQKRKSQDTAGNGPGSQSTLNTNQGEYDDTKRRNNKTHSSTGRKPTAVEIQQQAERAYWARKERDARTLIG